MPNFNFLKNILTEWDFKIEIQVQYKINKDGKAWDDYMVKYSMTHCAAECQTILHNILCSCHFIIELILPNNAKSYILFINISKH